MRRWKHQRKRRREQPLPSTTIPPRTWAQTAPDCPLTAEIRSVGDGAEHVLRLSGRELFSVYDELHQVIQRHLDQQAGDRYVRYMPVSGDG